MEGKSYCHYFYRTTPPYKIWHSEIKENCGAKMAQSKSGIGKIAKEENRWYKLYRMSNRFFGE
mgnify:CR=1 FL=1